MSRQVSSVEQAEAFIAELGKEGQEFLKDERKKHNRSLFARPGFRLPSNAATTAAQGREQRLTAFARAYGWKPSEDDKEIF